MAGALAGGLLRSGIARERVLASDVDESRRGQLETDLGIRTLDDNATLVGESDVVVLAVKPGVVADVLAALEPDPRPLWISIAAGVTLAALEGALPAGARIVRAMPNTPALAGAGATAICGNPSAAANDLEAVLVSAH